MDVNENERQANIKLFSDLQQVCDFFQGTPVSPNKKTDRHEKLEYCCFVALNTTSPPVINLRHKLKERITPFILLFHCSFNIYTYTIPVMNWNILF